MRRILVVHAPRDCHAATRDLVHTGSKDDGTDGTVAAPSDSKPRTGRPARLNTWEITADRRNFPPLLFAALFSLDHLDLPVRRSPSSSVRLCFALFRGDTQFTRPFRSIDRSKLGSRQVIHVG